jgi:hypothetical protein
MRLVSVERRASGENSLTIVTAFGKAAPNPTPVRNRRIVSSVKSRANADPQAAKPNSKVDTMSGPRRPKRSAIGPVKNAPKAIPSKAALNTGKRRPLKVPFSQQGRRDEADRAGIESIKQDDAEGHGEDEPLKSGDAMLAAERGGIGRH